ncbi:RNA polymerase sigma factor RpoE [Labilithrix luteola]|uniref:RNA polymerase sigma factor RpoE n=1 Tax=Labilithrix luteola TaxID=1391654 RepID=A0A0K1PNX4_9BACT|nr:sigma-70 family RNA polymerase sigma factor [Labilithrix luteola]AKU94819.1 RNA polymerase sigma factor RpoE [Labilithrix luteola]
MAEPDARDGQRDRVFRTAIAPLIDVAYRVLRRLGVHDREIDDALQTVLVAADRRFDELEGPTVLKAFVCASCVNVARDLGRRRARTTARTKDVEDLEQSPTSEPGPEDALGRKEGLAMVQRILTSMEEEKRVVFVLYELEELTGQEIADHLGIPVGTVSSRLRKAREEFRSAIARAHASERNLERSGR